MVFSLVGLVMTVFLAIGQVGLIAANADGWNDRSGGSNPSPVTVKGESSAREGTAPASTQVASSAPGRALGSPAIGVFFRGGDEASYNHATGVGGNSNDANETELNAENFVCGDHVVFYASATSNADVPAGTSMTLRFTYAKQNTGNQPFGYTNVDSVTLLPGDPNYVGNGNEALSPAWDTSASTATEIKLDVHVTNVDPSEVIWIRMVVTLGNCGPGNPNSEVQAQFDKNASSATNSVNFPGGSQTVGLKLPDATGSIEVVKDLTPDASAGNNDEFNLEIDGVAYATGGDGTTTGELVFLQGSYDVGETAVAPADLGDYSISVSCLETNTGAQIGPFSGAGPHAITLAAGEDWVCTIANTMSTRSLEITKSANVTTIGPNGLFTYTVTVTNTGNVQATGIDITDDLPNSLIPQSATFDVDPGTAGGTGTCDIGAGDIVHCPGSAQGTITLGASNPNNQSDTVVVTIQVKTGNTCRVLHNTASVNWNENPGTAITSNRVDVTVTGCSIAISKVASTVSPAVGSQFTYSILAESLDILPVTNVTITDTIPANLTIVSATYDVNPGAAGGTGNCSVSGQDVSCSVGTLAGYDNLTGDGPDAVKVIITVQAPNTCVQIENKASVQWTENGTKPPVDSNTATVTVTGCAPGLTLHKTGGDVAIGQNITWTITVSNTGNADASNVAISDTLPAGFTFVSSNPGSPTCTEAGGVVSCNLGTIAGGQSKTVDITATAPDTCGPYTNTVTGTFGTEETIPQATGSGDVTGCAPGLTLHKTGPGSVGVGGTVTYTVTVGNTGNADSTNVTVTDNVDANLTNVHATPSQGSCAVVGNAVSCDLGTIGAGGSATITISGTAPTTTCPTITNRAFIGELGSEIVTTTVTGCTTPPPPPPPPPPPTPGIQIVKDGPATAHVGDTITYTFDVSLISGSPSLTNVTVTDPICDAGTLTGPTGDDGDSVLEQSETWGYTCTHVVTSSDPDPLPNTATVEGHSGATTVTDDDSHEVDIVHPAIRIQKQARPQAGSPGDEITYTYTVTNTGDVTLFDISVDDDVIGHVCDIASLAPGESKECTATYTIPEDSPAHIRNVAVAEGHDESGVQVRDDDTEVIDFVLGQTITPTKTPPSGTAFTGSSTIIPLSVVALILLTAGTALLWVGRRRARNATTR